MGDSGRCKEDELQVNFKYMFSGKIKNKLI